MTKKQIRELEKALSPVRIEIKAGKCEKLKEFIKENLGFAVNHGLMHIAAEHDNVDALRVFVTAGISPDSISETKGQWTTPIWYAIYRRAYNAVNYLVDAGADINNTFNDQADSPFIFAASEGDLKMVKMFLERGANVNTSYLRDGKERFNALKWAVIEGHLEVADYLRSKGAVIVEDEKNPVLKPAEELLDDLSRYFKGKPLSLGVTEIVSASVPLSIHIFPPVKGKRKNTIFVTSGLIEYALVVPQGKEQYQFAEYFMEMPGSWPITSATIKQDEYYWPVAWLKAIGRYPHEKQTYYGEKRIVDSKMIPQLTTPDGAYHSALIERCSDIDLYVSQDGRRVVYYRVTTIEQ